ncbi:sporulation protein [Streptomyces griseomycini]|uniref:sporulation protein n=1 Tax=Streptomyces griseomycini TaxID=66895 RepID=UPI00342FD1CC
MPHVPECARRQRADGRATVENPDVRPGGQLRCRTVVKGGGASVRIDRFALEPVTRVEAREPPDTGRTDPGVVDVSAPDEGFVLGAGQTLGLTTTFEAPGDAAPAQDVFFQACLGLGFRSDEAEVKGYGAPLGPRGRPSHVGDGRSPERAS